jgi:hypothetical protein
MHDYELGDWRLFFIHLLRILDAADINLLMELDGELPYKHVTKYHSRHCRYREVPPFGEDTIRKFSSNSSKLKKLAARDFENLLQVLVDTSV